jgi:hypothetical protein
MVYEPGDELGWHFDNADFVVTVMLQPARRGGAFEHVPLLRTPADRNPHGVRALLAGGRSGVRTIIPAAGTLALFRGRLGPHRVTPITADTARINATLAYARTPDTRLSALPGGSSPDATSRPQSRRCRRREPPRPVAYTCAS